MIIVDTNVISYLFLPNEKYGRTAEDVLSADRIWIAPGLWYYEFFNVLTVYLQNDVFGKEFFIKVLSSAMDLIKTHDPVDQNIIIDLAEASSLSGYDCQYVALATEMSLPLVTEDKKILSEFPNIAVSMEAVIQKNRLDESSDI